LVVEQREQLLDSIFATRVFKVYKNRKEIEMRKIEWLGIRKVCDKEIAWCGRVCGMMDIG
jgi:hypothetical protein